MTCFCVLPITIFWYDIGLLYFAPWEDVTRTFTFPIRCWPLTLRSNVKGFWHVFVSDLKLLLVLTLAYNIWHMGLSPWEDVSSTFMILIRRWHLTSRSIKVKFMGFTTWLCFQASAFLSFDIVILSLALECILSLALECITMIRCVAYIHELCMTLTFDLNINYIFTMDLSLARCLCSLT